MKNQRFTLRSGLGWGVASLMIGTEMTKKLGWMEEAGVVSTDPTVVGGFSEILKYWNDENDMAFNYKLPEMCNVCMGDKTPFTKKIEPCTKIDIDEDRCMCNATKDAQHLCPHYRELGNDPLDVYVTLVKIEKTIGDDESGMFHYSDTCKTIYNPKLCEVGLVPKPLLEYGYFPIPIPRFKVPTADRDQLETFQCPTPLWFVSDLLPCDDAKLDDNVKLAKQGFGDDDVIATTQIEGVEGEGEEEI